ncbi:MAG: alpha/beta fold hydrolase [Sphingomonadaceae bacterium]|nr:alpha/beta fold hydrolase [Sphingomonadaceae bacterium]
MSVTTAYFEAADGIRLAWREMGEGRPVVLLHGYFSEADTNWIKYGHARLLADAGFRVIMPDLRAHGLSGKPHDPVHYPSDILADDQFALIDYLGLTDFDLGGYSLGGRTVARMLARGCHPRRAVISGMGLEGLSDTGRRARHFRHVLENLGKHERGSPAFMAEAFLKTTGGDPVALLRILDTFVDTPLDVIAGFDLPVAVVCGEDDDDNGSAQALADTLPRGQLFHVPGNHMSAVVKPELGRAIRDFLLEDF